MATINEAIKKSNYGIYGLKEKLPELWGGRILLFRKKQTAIDFWKNENMAIGFRNYRDSLFVFKITKGKKARKPIYP